MSEGLDDYVLCSTPTSTGFELQISSRVCSNAFGQVIMNDCRPVPFYDIYKQHCSVLHLTYLLHVVRS